MVNKVANFGICSLFMIAFLFAMQVPATSAAPATVLHPSSLASTGAISNQAQQVAYVGADLVILVDQSESTLSTDSGLLRFRATEYALEWLGYTLVANDLADEFDFRVTLLDFGTQPSDPPAQSDLLIAPSDEVLWLSDFESVLLPQIAPEANAARPKGTLGATNFYDALDRATTFFAAADEKHPTPRLKVVLLLTDGEADVEGQSWGEHMDEVQTLVQTKFPPSNHLIYVVAKNSELEWNNRIGARWDEITGNRAILVRDINTLGADVQGVMNDIMTHLGIDTEIQVSCGQLFVMPATEQFRLTVHKPNSSTGVVLVDPNDVPLVSPDGRPFGLSNGSMVVPFSLGRFNDKTSQYDSVIEATTVLDPQPGSWKIECPSESSPPMFIRTIRADSNLFVLGTPLFRLPLTFRYELYRRNGQPLAPYEGGDHQIVPRLTFSDNSTNPVTLGWDSESQAYVGTWTPNALGTYTATFAATTRNTNGAETDITRITNVLAVDSPQLEISPTEEWLPLRESPIYIEIQNAQESAISLPAEGAFEVTLDVLDLKTGQTIPLNNGVLEADGRFRFELVPDPARSYLLAAHLSAINTDASKTHLADSIPIRIETSQPRFEVSGWTFPFTQNEPQTITVALLTRTGENYVELVPEESNVQVTATLTYLGNSQQVELRPTTNNEFVGRLEIPWHGEIPIVLWATGRASQQTAVPVAENEMVLSVLPSPKTPVQTAAFAVLMPLGVALIIFAYWTYRYPHNERGGYLVLKNEKGEVSIEELEKVKNRTVHWQNALEFKPLRQITFFQSRGEAHQIPPVGRFTASMVIATNDPQKPNEPYPLVRTPRLLVADMDEPFSLGNGTSLQYVRQHPFTRPTVLSLGIPRIVGVKAEDVVDEHQDSKKPFVEGAVWNDGQYVFHIRTILKNTAPISVCRATLKQLATHEESEVIIKRYDYASCATTKESMRLRERATQEADILRNFEWVPGMVPYAGFEKVSETMDQLVTGFVEGRSLDKLISEGPIPLEQALTIIRRLCDTVHALHHGTYGVIHRDISPSNVIQSKQGSVFLLDFTNATTLLRTIDEPYIFVGTEAFRAPSDFNFNTNHKGDIYSIALLLIALIKGTNAPRSLVEETLQSGTVVISSLETLRSTLSGVDDHLIKVLRQALRGSFRDVNGFKNALFPKSRVFGRLSRYETWHIWLLFGFICILSALWVWETNFHNLVLWVGVPGSIFIWFLVQYIERWELSRGLVSDVR